MVSSMCLRSSVYAALPLVLLVAHCESLRLPSQSSPFDLRSMLFGALGNQHVGVHKQDVEQFGALKIHVYSLPSKFNLDLIERVAGAVPPQDGTCGLPVQSCTMHAVTKGNLAHFYDYMNEVAILRKFIALLEQMPSRAGEDPAEADLFIVPAFFSTANFVMPYINRIIPESGPLEQSPPSRTAFGLQDILPLLPYFNESTSGRHLFLRTHDCNPMNQNQYYESDFNPKTSGCRFNTPDFVLDNAMFLTLGPKNQNHVSHSRHIVVPPAITERELQPSVYVDDSGNSRPNLIFLMASANTAGPTGTLRKILLQELESYIEAGAQHVDLVVMGVDRSVGLTQSETIARLKNATFCPCPPGDLPFQKRFYLALLSGCIPVMILFDDMKGHQGWWAHGYPSVDDAYPWPNQTPYQELVFEVSISDVVAGRLVKILEAVPDKEIKRRRRKIANVRNKFVIDYEGSAPDGFTMILESIHKHLGSIPSLEIP